MRNSALITGRHGNYGHNKQLLIKIQITAMSINY